MVAGAFRGLLAVVTLDISAVVLVFQDILQVVLLVGLAEPVTLVDVILVFLVGVETSVVVIMVTSVVAVHLQDVLMAP